VWAPTLPGWGLLAGSLALALAGLGLGVPRYLAQTDPVGRGLLVVEGWLPAEAVEGAVEAYRRGGYELFVMTGGPIEEEICPPGHATYAERGAGLARGFGLRDDDLAVVPAPASAQERTFRSAVSLRQWAEASGRTVSALDVYSYGTHARRSRWLFQRAFGDGVEVGVIAAAPSRYEPAAWWRTSEGARAVLSETAAWAWVQLLFDPGARGSRQEQWGPPSDAPHAR